MTRRLFILTPARDERDTLPRLAQALAAQSLPITLWLVLENGSSDDTRAFIEAQKPQNILPQSTLNEILCPPESALNLRQDEQIRYALGSKYARIIAAGLAILQETLATRGEPLCGNDLVGIMDADTIPEPDYFAKLAETFDMDEKLGLTSGLTTDEKDSPTPHNPNWVRGACRLWRWQCLMDMGEYPIGPSADTLSAIKAELAGWRVHVSPAAKCQMRSVGSRTAYTYYGQSSYFRGETLLHALLRSGSLALRRHPHDALYFLAGYLKNWLTRAEQISDPAILGYSRTVLWRRLDKALRRH